jgi:hypothetical protein
MTTTTDRARLAIPLLQAIVEGKRLQNLIDNSWSDCGLDWSNHDMVQILRDPASFRVKPVPREWWQALCDDHDGAGVFLRGPYTDRLEAIRCNPTQEVVHVREVIP